MHGITLDSNSCDNDRTDKEAGRMEGCDQKLCMDNFFSSPELFNDFTKK
jgi:hypothetical protein